MAYAKGIINISKLLAHIEEGKAEFFKSKDGDDMVKVNINFSNRLSMNGSNTTISLFNPGIKGKCIFGNFKLDYEHLKNDGLV